MSCLSIELYYIVELYVYHRQYTKVLQLVLIHCGTMSSEKRVPNVPKEYQLGYRANVVCQTLSTQKPSPFWSKVCYTIDEETSNSDPEKIPTLFTPIRCA